MKERGRERESMLSGNYQSFTISGMNIYPDLLILPNVFFTVNSPYFMTVALRRSFTVLYRYNFC